MNRALSSWLLASSVGAAGLLLGAPARADDEPKPAARSLHAPLPGSDGVYGRFDGSLTLAASAGAELEDSEPRGALKISAHYMWTAGAYARYSDAFGHADQRPDRVASLGVDLRPLFLPRFARDYEHGPALLDLTLDSLSLSAGAYFAEPRGRAFGDERGFETGLGFGIPLLGEARGPWLEARAERRFADHGQNAWLFTLALAYHALTWSTTPDDP
jgi:hypothetical protein